MLNVFPHFHQYDAKDCGPACLRIISKYYGKSLTLQDLRARSRINKEGVSMLGLSQAAESLGFRTVAARINYQTLIDNAPFPCVVHWDSNHFVVVYKVKKDLVYVSDPARSRMVYKKEEFISHWAKTKNGDELEGIVLILEPTPTFYEHENEKGKGISFSLISRYLVNYKGLLLQMLIGIACVSASQLIFPFLTRSIVDYGINFKDLHFVYLLLAAQLMLFFGRTSVDFIRSWILLHISTRINVSIISDFFIKLMRLPMRYFDSKTSGDILQRVNDHQRIENFLTTNTLNFFFSLLSLIVFSIVLGIYNGPIFFTFLISTVIYACWVILFMRRIKELDYKKFDIYSQNSDKIIMLISGMQEIKLNNSEHQKRWEWERVQARLFKVNIRGLALGQYQQAGAFFINEGRNILITFLAAKFVIDGQISLGTMLAIQYIIGQLNAPVEQFVVFLQSFQEASISLERLNEIHEQEDEEAVGKALITHLPAKKDVLLDHVTFKYPGTGLRPVLKDISLRIPHGQVTAIVGASGSGKTTLLKLLLKYYRPDDGTIRVGNADLDSISNHTWRAACGVVMQDGFIFPDTIANNIAVGVEEPDIDQLMYACEVANILEFIDTLPLGFNTRIGADGVGISEGQKQRMLIARSVYKDPEIIYFDEATNSLDANNERVIMRNLDKFFSGRTVVVVAHRLSTVRNADQIVVLNDGEIVELGTHAELTGQRGKYFELVKNQLELGS